MSKYSLITDKSWHATMLELADTFRKWKGVTYWNVTPALRGAKEYRKAENWNQSIYDRAVVLEYKLRGTTVTLTMDKQQRAVDNLRVLYLAVEDMRMIEARGISDVVKEAYLQLAAPAATATDPYAVLGVGREQSLAEIEQRYRELAAQLHPDKPGGDTAKFQALTEAMQAIRRERKK
jgi:DnaJ-domain-containing protein 1